jgi:hypothetical protein
MYKKPIEILVKEVDYEPLSPEVSAAVIADLLPRAAIEQMIPERTAQS